MIFVLIQAIWALSICTQAIMLSWSAVMHNHIWCWARKIACSCFCHITAGGRWIWSATRHQIMQTHWHRSCKVTIRDFFDNFHFYYYSKAYCSSVPKHEKWKNKSLTPSIHVKMYIYLYKMHLLCKFKLCQSSAVFSEAFKDTCIHERI